MSRKNKLYDKITDVLSTPSCGFDPELFIEPVLHTPWPNKFSRETAPLYAAEPAATIEEVLGTDFWDDQMEELFGPMGY